MFNRSKRILSIDPGTYYSGFAVLDEGKLIHYGVKEIRVERVPHLIIEEGRKTILRMIKDFKPNILVVEKTFFSKHKNTSILNVFADEIMAMGKMKRLKVMSYAPNTVKKFITGNGYATKERVAEQICLKYPELRAYMNQGKKWKDRYHQNMFDAVALGVVCQNYTNVVL